MRIIETSALAQAPLREATMEAAPLTTGYDESDTVAVLFPINQETKERNGAFPGKTLLPDGKKDGFSLRGNTFFQAETLTYTSIDDLFLKIEALAAAGESILVRGEVVHDGAYIRRTKVRYGKCPPGLRSARLRLMVLDLDAWPNVDKLDPRRDPAACWDWIVDKLGAEFEGVRMIGQWTSSCCHGDPTDAAPAFLHSRLFAVMDRGLGESGMRDLLWRLDGRVKAFYATRGVVFPKMGNGQWKKAVDPAVGTCIQPIYIAAPRLADGVTDPMAGFKRVTLLPGGRAEVCLGDLWASLPSLEQARETAAGTTGTDDTPADSQATRRALKPRSRTRVPGEVLPLGAAALEIEVMRRAMAAKTPEEWMEGCKNFFLVRVALEIAALALHRGGLVEGTRDECSLRIASCLVAGMPLGKPDEWVRAQVRTVLNLAAGPEWVRKEWEEGGADCSVIGNYRRASQGEKGRGGWRDPRYAYCKARLLAEWQPSQDEIKALRLRSLCTDADRRWAEREIQAEADNTPVREAWLLGHRMLAPTVHRLRAQHYSVRKIASLLGIHANKVQRLLALTASQVAEVDAWISEQEAQQAADVAEAMQAVGSANTDDAEAIVSELMARGIHDAGAIAEASGLPRDLVANLLDWLGVDADEDSESTVATAVPLRWPDLRLAA